VNVKERIAHERMLLKVHKELKTLKQNLKHSHAENERLAREIEAKNKLKKVNTFTITPHHDSGKGEAVAVWLASDFHVEERVTLAQTNGLNEYNLDISKARAEQYFRKAVRLTQLFGRDVEIKTVVLALLGDFITNDIHEQAATTNYLPPTEATLYAQSLIASGIQFVLDNTDWNLVIPCISGNHSRTSQFSMFGSENGHSLEYMMYRSLESHFKTPRVRFLISEGAHQYVNVFDYTIRFIHGHDVKFNGGVGGVLVPFNKAIAQWDKGRRANFTCAGHFHQYYDGTNSKQGAVVNGSLVGYNSFALSIKASYEPPAQMLFLLDKKRGKTITCPILFD